MRFIHLSDLHLGKRVNGFSMLEDQKYILDQIVEIIKKSKIDAVLICGDVYDKSSPSAEAVCLFDDFLTTLAEIVNDIFVISGNHDSAERLAFGSRLMESEGVHISPVFDGSLKHKELKDEYGSLNVWMLPFIRPSDVRRFYSDDEINDHTAALECVISHAGVDTDARNIILSHQFVTGAVRCESETISVGGTDNVDVSVFEDFDYTALGHIHGPQNISSKGAPVRYCGTPLKYSFSEINHKKSLSLIEICEKGNIKIDLIPLIPLHEMRKIQGTYNDLTLRENYKNTDTDDYIFAVLTDEDDVPFALNRLRQIYPNIMKLEYDNSRTRSSNEVLPADITELKSELELFEDFYSRQNGHEMNKEAYEYSKSIFDELKGKI